MLAQGIAPTQALRESVIWLRELTHEALKEEVAPLRQQANRNELKELNRLNKRYPNALPFASPVYWAAFTVNGSLHDGTTGPEG